MFRNFDPLFQVFVCGSMEVFADCAQNGACRSTRVADAEAMGKPTGLATANAELFAAEEETEAALAAKACGLLITTITGKRLPIDAADSDPLSLVKARVHELEGVPVDQQSLWFPVAEAVKGTQYATEFPWWDAMEARLDEVLRESLLSGPLYQLADVATLAEARARVRRPSRPS